MKKDIKLKDDRELVLRQLKKKDRKRLTVFFKSLPKEDRIYLRVDVTDKEAINQIIKSSQLGQNRRIIALNNDTIVAAGLLELEQRKWKKHFSEIRLLVSKEFRRKGLGMIIARELYLLAISEKVEEIIVKMMKPQVAAIDIFSRMGFKQEAVLSDYVRDLEGTKQDLIIMRCDVNEMWKELEDYLEDSDWQRTR
jgi:L-amino acid N-acyltransferase YncA